MIEFSVRLANRPGQLAALARLFADASIDIEAFAAVADNGKSHVRIVVERAVPARRLLTAAGVEFEEHDILDTFVPRGSGALAEITESLAHAGVNIDSLYLLHTNAEGFHFAITVSETDTALRVLAS